MAQVPFRVPWGFVAAAVLAAAMLPGVSSAGHAQEVVALVNGEPITALDIEHRAKFTQMSTNKVPARQDVINELIDETLELGEAHRYGIDVPDSEVDNAFAGVGTRMGADPQKLTEILEKGGASAGTLKHRLRAQLAWDALVRGRYKASLEIADSDVEAELDLHKPQDKNQVGYEYALRPIVLIVPRGAPDTAFEARKRDADALRVRFLTCADGIPFTRALREVAVRDPVTKFSADLPPELRDILDKTDVGHLTPPEQTTEGIQMFALCGKKENKSDTPGKKEVRDELFQQKFGAQAKRYLAEIRRGAMIEYK
ncbi:MAG TPA: SurA N-terminal domain-containing protein [Xanthobacteraceae bacterium]|nr:SurA N-terminal domain-containing protein [Xanthobacteraceae bacterium]